MHYVHLQCRIAMPNSTARRRDMSHTIHSDNCDFADNGTCKNPDHKEPLSWRDYSAVIYLNSDFHGGQTVFAKTPRTSIRGIVRPKCGRMVSFASETAHGVLPVFTGKRCAVLVWMTHTRRKEEKRRALLDSVLREIDGRVRNSSERDDRWDFLWQMKRD
ncbi:prolyl 3-hydroxylase 2 isoform X2 [Dermacentor silvarum]|nr:prolyl 3-hydroxylase 2 isoform X2 [Dermacentor silvarum]XP_049515320.1 prolyl 3-hydroxylase 2 isoform X2 [Dermacentor silvarum]